jgi:Mce-associated membrane protein
MADADERPQDSAKANADAIALAEEAEAEAAEAEALAAAARARARAIRLRREAQATAEGDDKAKGAATKPAEVEREKPETSEPAETSETPEPSETPDAPAASTEPAPRWWRGRRLATALTATTIAAICGLLGASGWMLWHHHSVTQARQRSADFKAVAKQEVINLTSLDFNKAKEGVQRILDNATGEFRDDFQRRADDFASVVKDSKAVTEGSVAAAAVESMGKDSAVVLVLANERVTNIAGAKDERRSFRFRVSVVRDGDQMKVSKVDFVL